MFSQDMKLLSIAEDCSLNFIASTSLSKYWRNFHISWHKFFMKRIFIPLSHMNKQQIQVFPTIAVVAFSTLLHGISFGHWIFFAVFNCLALIVEQWLQGFCWYRNQSRAVLVLNQMVIFMMLLGMSGIYGGQNNLNGIGSLLVTIFVAAPLIFLAQIASGVSCGAAVKRNGIRGNLMKKEV